ncbi:MAG: hypothetical protein Q8P78_02615 [bacterium]|nr:hypothetical protein [bacterium]
MLSRKNKLFFPVIAIAVFGVLATAAPAHAQETIGWVATIMSSIASVIIELAGKLLIVLIELLLVIVKYNEFINAPAVERGWILIRDFTNMAFLVIFIAIAYATILGVEKYEWKRLLPKLLMMAVAVNFSKTISGVVIDAAQVLMITFVNGFKDVAAGNLIRGLGLADMLSIRQLGADENVTDSAIAAASILAVVLLVIAVIVVGVIVMMFLVRIMYLWILIIMAPLAFLMGATPGAEHLFKQWWDRLIRYAFVGPIMAFWLWLSFSVMAGVAPGYNLAKDSKFDFSGGAETGFVDVTGNTAAAISGISTSDQLLSYAISIALLIYSLIVAKGMGVKGAGIAGSALDKIKSGGIKLGKFGALVAATGGVPSALGVIGGYQAGKGARALSKTGLGKYALKNLDRKYGKKIVKPLALVGQALAPTKNLKSKFANLAEKTPRIGKVQETWMRHSEDDRKIGTSVSEARNDDDYNERQHGIQTDREYMAFRKFVDEGAKEFSAVTEDEDATVSEFLRSGDEFQNAVASGNQSAIQRAAARMLGLEKLVVQMNAQNTAMAGKEGELLPRVVAAMGDIDASPENLAKYLSVFYKGEQTAGGQDIQDELDRISTIDDSTATGKLQKTTELKELFRASENQNATDEDIKRSVGNGLYAHHYKIYDKTKEAEWGDQSVPEAKKLARVIINTDGSVNQDARAVQAHHDGTVEDKGQVSISADARHWQAMQAMFHQGAGGQDFGDVVGVKNLRAKIERDLGVESVKAGNAAFGFGTKWDAKSNMQVTVNLSGEDGIAEHSRLYSSKLKTMNVPEIARFHEMSTLTQSFAINDTGDVIMYYNDNAPTHKRAEIQAVAAGDARGLANERIASAAGHAGVNIDDLEHPLTDTQRLDLVKQFHFRNNPVNGIMTQMPDNVFVLKLMKFMKTIGVGNITNEASVRTYLGNNGIT